MISLICTTTCITLPANAARDHKATTDRYADESAPRELIVGELPDDLPDANEGAFEGGLTGTHVDPTLDNIFDETILDKQPFFNVPTNGPPSPLFGVGPFSQQMMRLEEFGTRKLNFNRRVYKRRFPLPPDAQSSPDPVALDRFMRRYVSPLPRKYANTKKKNPWQPVIEEYLGRKLDNPPAEGRPPGIGWAHQRWNEFKPKVYFQTAQTEARENLGMRDRYQSHRYRKGEFGRWGLYHNPSGEPGSQGSCRGVRPRLHPDLPEQDPDSLWTFDGTFPPKLLKVRYGEPVLMRHYNALPIDVSHNGGFGLHTISTHEHNGHNPAESDGYTNAFFFPGQFYDYRWPIVLAGHDSINVDATDPRAGAPDGRGGIKKIPGDWRETMSTHWFHDHMLDFTAQNVYKGNAAMMNYYSAIDRGNEAIDDGVNLRLPSGSALDWGNRDYDVNLMIADKAWDAVGQLWFNPFNQRGFIGDVMTVNWLYKPYLDVRARRYRFRILNASVSRYFKLALVNEYGDPVPFHMVANDGNIMEHTVLFENGEMPTLGIAERYDIVIDFGKFKRGERLYLVNMLQHKDGQVTDTVVPLDDIVSERYSATPIDDDGDGTADRWNADPAVGPFLEFRVQRYRRKDKSMDPAEYVAGKKKMIPIRRPTEEELQNALHRSFEFEREATDENPWVIQTDGGKGYTMDPRRLSAAPEKNSSGLEVWSLVNSGTWSHPIHIHFEEGVILRRNGEEPPEWEKWARKDVYRLGPQPDSGVSVDIALRFREFAGTYMEHCHNTQHEDHAMLLRWDIENPGQTKLMPAPIPSWDGVSYVDTVALPTFRSGDAVGEFGPELQPVDIWLAGARVNDIDLVNVEIGDALNPTNDERASITIPLIKGTNNSNGELRDVYFVLHDISDQQLAEQLGIAWAGALQDTPDAALSEATYQDGVWTFYGDLPNPITGKAGTNPEDIPAQRDDNDYSPLRRVTINGKEVIVNAFFVQWGEEPWESLRIDHNCHFPDDPPNTNCMYNGQSWGRDTAHALAIDTNRSSPSVTFKLHKSWAERGDYLPYYVVVDSFPAGPANNMGVIYVPKHAHLGRVAVPLVQFLPPERLNDTYPPTPSDGFGLAGGGPLGGQIGLPSYFMPEDDYSPMWHIGFAHWQQPATEVVKGLDRVKQLRKDGLLQIHEWPAVRVGTNDYDFTNDTPPHVVNCPVPVTIDSTIHKARKIYEKARNRADSN